jgi:hypothetical protein
MCDTWVARADFQTYNQLFATTSYGGGPMAPQGASHVFAQASYGF